MLSSGAKVVPSSACLRCQLRCVLQHLRSAPSTGRRPYTPSRAFSIAHNRQDAHESDTAHQVEKKNGLYYRHILPNGRIVGKKGRKQRQTSEALATKSLGEQSEIVVFRDVVDTRSKIAAKPKDSKELDAGEAGLKGLSLTAEQIRTAMSETDEAPNEEDVDASIDALRPHAPALEEPEFDRLVKDLLDSYNMRQLSRYLRRSLLSHKTSTTVVRKLTYKSEHSPAQGTRTITFTRSRWQPGRTPLEKRRTLNIPSPDGVLSSPKARVVERIVRVAWEVTTKSEEAEVGELEIEMLPWMLAMFFDLSVMGKPKYHTLIEPPMLLRKSQIRPYRPDGIIRITARRFDAEEIATQLEDKVLLMGKLQLDLSKFGPNNNTKQLTGMTLQHFRKSEVLEISQRTQSVFIQQTDGTIGIHSFKRIDRANARRLLLSLMNFTSRNAHHMKLGSLQVTESQPANLQVQSTALVPVYPGRGLHFRDRSKKFARVTTPVQRKGKQSEPVTESSLKTRAADIALAIESMTPSLDQEKAKTSVQAAELPLGSDSYWAGTPFTAHRWRVNLGLLLQQQEGEVTGNLLTPDKTALDHNPNNTNDSDSKTVFLRQVPEHETILSYFLPFERPAGQTVQEPDRTQPDRVARKSTIKAHFIPSPFDKYGPKALHLFPHLELTLQRSYNGSEGVELKIEGLHGVLEKQVVDVPLPDQAIDLRLTREVTADAFKPAVLADTQIRKFVTALNQSVRAKGALQGTTEITFKMPGWMGQPAGAGRQAQDESLPEIPVTYLFDRFEQVQSTGFRKNKEALDERAQHSAPVKLFNDHFFGIRLDYREVEAGDIGGRHTDISFKEKTAAPERKVAIPGDTGIAALPGISEDRAGLKAVLVRALAMAGLFTSARKRETTAWRGSSGPADRESAPLVRKPKDARHQKTTASEEVAGLNDGLLNADTDIGETPPPADGEAIMAVDGENTANEEKPAGQNRTDQAIEG